MMRDMILALFRETAALMQWTELTVFQMYNNIVTIERLLDMNKIMSKSSLVSSC